MTGWVIGVMVEVAGEPQPLRHFYAIGHEDRAKAEWTALDAAMLVGGIATSPFRGLEPVQMLAQLTPARMKRLGLLPKEVRALGRKWPRRWLEVEA
ncbi:MAG TPA: hypothetical protein VFW47_00640 [Phenylobacterium sp.]|nr:hypothetical protein [Phenylobacterium sp.]